MSVCLSVCRFLSLFVFFAPASNSGLIRERQIDTSYWPHRMPASSQPPRASPGQQPPTRDHLKPLLVCTMKSSHCTVCLRISANPSNSSSLPCYSRLQTNGLCLFLFVGFYYFLSSHRKGPQVLVPFVCGMAMEPLFLPGFCDSEIRNNSLCPVGWSQWKRAYCLLCPCHALCPWHTRHLLLNSSSTYYFPLKGTYTLWLFPWAVD